MKRRLMSFAVMFTLILPSVFAQSNDVWKPGTVEPSTSEISPLREIPPSVVQVLYNNGPIVTHPGGGAGGADASALQTALGMTSIGFTASSTGGVRLADEFTVTGGGWQITDFVFYGYQTGSTTTSTFTEVNFRIWNGPPNNPGSAVVFGDTTTNRLASTGWSNIYRVLDTSLPNTQRPVMANHATAGVTLAPGTYWVDFALSGSLASGPFVPPITILGQTSTGNALQFFNAAWNTVNDVGPQGIPFLVEGTVLGATPIALVIDGTGNRVLDPSENATAAPSWRNDGVVSLPSVTGTLSNFIGPAGGTYVITDAAASYGSIAAGATVSCTGTANCYSLLATATTRPMLHWDAAATETLSNGDNKTWTIHIGNSFTDVQTTSPFYRFIETLLHNGVTGGCGSTTYCPSASSTRAQMAVFTLISKEGAGYLPPACVPPNLFSDVPETSPFCRFIEELANRGVVAGCGANLYCPAQPVSRQQMAVFVLRTLDPVLNPPPCVAGTEMFGDMPASNPFCRWVEELARRGVVTGCGGGNYCPAAPVTRQQMGVFLSVSFGLSLYHP